MHHEHFSKRSHCILSIPNFIYGRARTLSHPILSNTVFITLFQGTNPTSQRDAGSLTISTFTEVSGTDYKADSGSASNLFTPTGGVIHKNAEIALSTYTTYAADVTYTFSIRFDHAVPEFGKVKISLPQQVTISSTDKVKNECTRVDTG